MVIPKAFSPEEVAEIASVTRRTVYNWIASGELVAIKAGPRLWRVPETELKRMLKEGSYPKPTAAELAAFAKPAGRKKYPSTRPKPAKQLELPGTVEKTAVKPVPAPPVVTSAQSSGLVPMSYAGSRPKSNGKKKGRR